MTCDQLFVRLDLIRHIHYEQGRVKSRRIRSIQTYADARRNTHLDQCTSGRKQEVQGLTSNWLELLREAELVERNNYVD